MKTLVHSDESALQLLLKHKKELVTTAPTSVKPAYRADKIAAAVAESGNPSGA